MQMIKNLFRMCLLVSFISPCLASPPVPVLRTCVDNQIYNDKVSLSELDGDGFSEKSMEGCKDQYDREVNGHLYGTLSCKNKFYLLINDKKIDPSLANNMSINPEIKPGVEFTTRSLWYKINFGNKEYLCIFAPLSEQGVGSSHKQYYIIEHAFEAKENPELYFYFFEKNIVPITSNNL
jgi:hypothetical protein